MSRRRSPILLYWLLQFVGLGLTIVWLSWHFHVTEREAMPEPAFMSVLIILLICAPFTKGLSLVSGHFLVGSYFWQVNLRIVRVLLYYFLDLACSAATLSVLWLTLIGWLFTDAGFPIIMTIFPYAFINGVILSWYTPRPVRKTPVASNTGSPAPAAEPLQHQLRDFSGDPCLVLPVTLVLALLFTGIAGMARSESIFQWLSLSLFIFPLALAAIWLYLLPATIAWRRIPHHARLVLVVTLVTGWTGFGWLACLLWSVLVKRTRTNTLETWRWRQAGLWLVGLLGLVVQGIGLGLFEDNGYGIPGFILLAIGSILLLTAVTRYFPLQEIPTPA